MRHPPGPAIFFYKPDEEPFGVFSQWYKCRFTDPRSGLTFNCAEQWMMWNKARMSGDGAAMREIMKTSKPWKQKQIGRGVRGFDPAEWDRIKFGVVVRGNLLKFSQCDNRSSAASHRDIVPLRKILLATGDLYLCEASGADRVWGIGFEASEAKGVPKSQWGQNLLGRALCEVRERLR